MSGSKGTAAAGAGATQRVPEQDQDANGRSTRQGAEGAGAEGLSAESSAGAESKRGHSCTVQCKNVCCIDFVFRCNLKHLRG